MQNYSLLNELLEEKTEKDRKNNRETFDDFRQKTPTEI